MHLIGEPCGDIGQNLVAKQSSPFLAGTLIAERQLGPDGISMDEARALPEDGEKNGLKGIGIGVRDRHPEECSEGFQHGAHDLSVDMFAGSGGNAFRRGDEAAEDIAFRGIEQKQFQDTVEPFSERVLPVFLVLDGGDLFFERKRHSAVFLKKDFFVKAVLRAEVVVDCGTVDMSLLRDISDGRLLEAFCGKKVACGRENPVRNRICGNSVFAGFGGISV